MDFERADGVLPLPSALGAGWVARVAIPDRAAAPASWADWSALTPREQAHARAARPRRGAEFTAGRVALRRALAAAGGPTDHPCLPGEQGRPVLPGDFTGSITHKIGFAYAVAGLASDGTLGIDCEDAAGRDRSSIASRVLRPSELARWEAAGRSWPALLEVFSLKEAIYKAIHPWVPRWIDFDEAELHADGRIEMHVAEGSFDFVSAVERDGPRLLSFVRVRPRGV